ncbi:MAG: 50S ribosomal protein L22 [Sumerlaeia bacterium]
MGRRSQMKARRKELPQLTPDGREVVSKATARFVRSGPRKLALVAELIRNKSVDEALEILQFTHKPSAVPHVEKILRSAVANAANVAPDPYDLVIGDIRVESGPMMKRIRPASMGRAVRVRKRLSHIHLTLTNP